MSIAHTGVVKPATGATTRIPKNSIAKITNPEVNKSVFVVNVMPVYYLI